MVRPEHIAVSKAGEENASAKVETVAYHGPMSRYRLRHDSGIILQTMSLGVPKVAKGDGVHLELLGEPVRVSA